MLVNEIDRKKLYANTEQFVKFVLDPLNNHPRFQLELVLHRIDFMISNHESASNEFKQEFRKQMEELNLLFVHIHKGRRAREFFAA